MSELRHFIEAILNPLFLLLIAFAIGLFFLYQSEVSRGLFYKFVVIFVGLLIVSTGWLPNFLINTIEKNYHVIVNPDPSVQWIVLLSGGQSDEPSADISSVLTSASLKRLIETERLAAQLPMAKVILSGGSYNDQPTEAENLLAVLELWKGQTSEIILEKKSLNTASQAKEIKTLIGSSPFYLVTSALHMNRAMRLCKAQGLNPIAAPADFIYYWRDERWEKFYLPNAQNIVYLTLALHEILGIIWHRITA